MTVTNATPDWDTRTYAIHANIARLIELNEIRLITNDAAWYCTRCCRRIALHTATTIFRNCYCTHRRCRISCCWGSLTSWNDSHRIRCVSCVHFLFLLLFGAYPHPSSSHQESNLGPLGSETGCSTTRLCGGAGVRRALAPTHANTMLPCLY